MAAPLVCHIGPCMWAREIIETVSPSVLCRIRVLRRQVVLAVGLKLRIPDESIAFRLPNNCVVDNSPTLTVSVRGDPLPSDVSASTGGCKYLSNHAFDKVGNLRPHVDVDAPILGQQVT